MPRAPIEFFGRNQGITPRPFSSPAAGPPAPGGEDQSVVAGFLGSVISSVPELFGAPPTPEAEAFRSAHPFGGFVSELGGFAIPYLGAERVAQLPSIAPKLARGVESVLGRVGLSTAENPVWAGVTRELIVNAPVEASRLAVGTTQYPDNTDLWSDVAINYALTGGIGGLGGFFRAGGRVLSKAGQVEGADIFMAPTHQLKMVLDEGAAVKNVPTEEFIPRLREQVLTETPGTGAASKKPLDYVLPLEGMTRDDSKAINSLFEVGRQTSEETGELTGLAKQLLTEGKGKNQLKVGEQQVVLDMLPDSFQTIDDVAKEVQFPRRLVVADKDGARQFAGIMSKPGWRQVTDRLSLMQERDGGFVFSYKLADGDTGPSKLAGVIKDEAGKPLTFYHGTARPYEGLPSPSENRIPQGMTVFSTDAETASRYAKQGAGTTNDAVRVFPVHIKSSKIADFRKPEDLAKARKWWVQWADKHGQPFSEDRLKKGDWGMWENAEMLKANGWDGAFITEVKKGGGTELNIAVQNPNKVISTFDRGGTKQIGKGAGKTEVGAQYLIGKTLNPGALAPEAQKMAELVKARWAKWGAAFGPQRFDDVFNANADLMIKSMSVIDYHNLAKLPEREWKSAFKTKLGKTMAGEEGLLDSKLGYKDSKTINDLTDWAYSTFKPTEFLQRQNPVYGRFFGLMRNAYRTGDEFASRIMRGQAKLEKGTTLSQAIRSKGVKYVSGFEGHRPIAQIINDMSDAEVNLMAHLSGTDSLGDDGLAKLINDGELTEKGAAAIKELRAINEDVISKLVMPVFKETGQDVKWLENHLGIPRVNRGDLFYTVVDAETGAPKHLAFGKTGAQAMREAKLVQEAAKDAGKNWKIEVAKPRHVAAESEDALAALGRDVFQNIQRTPEEGEVIYRAMKRLGTIKSTSGRNPAIPVSSGMFRERTAVQTSAALATYSKKDVLNSMEGHLKQLLHFAGMQSWKERFGSVAAHMLKDQDPMMYQDLIRKGNQMLGIEGQITNALNEALRPVFGKVLGAKPATKIASAVNKYMAAATLFWLNPTFAVLNLLTPLQTVAPWIAHMKIGSAADLEKTMFMQLQPSFNQAGMLDGVAAFTDPMKVLGASVKLIRNPTDELKSFYEAADTDGLFHPQIFEEWLGRHTRAQQTLGGAWKEDGIAGFLKQMATYPADASEKFSRLTAFNAGYLIGKNYFNLEGDALYRFMRRAVEVTQYNYSAIDRSRLFTGPVGSMFGLFKNWQMHFIGNMLGYAGLIKNDAANPAAWAPLLWTMGSATALGGLGATPLLMAADGIANWHEKGSNSFLWTQQHFADNPEIGDAIYFGLPAFLGVSLQSSASIPGTDVRNETASLFSFAMWQRAKQLGKAGADMTAQYKTTGQVGLDDPNIRDELFSAIMPRFITKLFSTIEGDYVRSMSTGAPQVRNVSTSAKLLAGAGFNPIEIEQYQQASRRMYKDSEARKQLVEGLGRAYTDSILNGDDEEAQRVIQRAIAAGELPSVLKSSATRMHREQAGDILSRYDKQQQGVYREALAPR